MYRSPLPGPPLCKGRGISWKESIAVCCQTMVVRKLGQAKFLRKAQTNAEELLWQKLRAKRFHSFKFRRQVPKGKYIVDFYCPRKKLIIEIDGDVHASFKKKSDRQRDEYFFLKGYTILRIPNHFILNDLDKALELISDRLEPEFTLSLLEGEG